MVNTIYIKRYIYILYILFCTPTVARQIFWLCYECNCMKDESHKYVCVVIRCKMQEKNYWKQQFIWKKWIKGLKSIQLKVYSHHAKNIWISFLILILIFWWIQLAVWEATEKFIKILSLIFEGIWKVIFVWRIWYVIRI